MAQFADVRIVYQHWNLIRTRLHLHRVLEGIKADPGPVLSSMMDRKLKAELEAACREVAGQLVSVLDAVIALLQDMLHEPARGRPGSRYVLVDEEYYNASTPCISCRRMTTARQPQSCTRQTSCWWAFSRVSKMPSCFHLVDRGIKAANVPLVPELPLLQELTQLRRPVIGPTFDPLTLVEIRRTQVRLMAPGGVMGRSPRPRTRTSTSGRSAGSRAGCVDCAIATARPPSMSSAARSRRRRRQ